MSDGRSEPRNPKKRPERAAGGASRRGSDDARRRSAEPRKGSDRPRRADDAGRGSGGRPARGDRAPAPEPGFGPFKREERPGAAKAGGRKQAEEARAVRSVAEEAVARASGDQKPALRIVHGTSHNGEAAHRAKGGQPAKGKGAKRGGAAGSPATPRPKPVRDGGRLQEAIVRGARALERGYEREALKILRPWREVHADSADLRELLGLTYYRLGRWSLAHKELEAFGALTGSTEQHPVLMDCARALGRFDRVQKLWEELRAASPAAEIVTEGRIVAAGALADQGRFDEAIKILERAPGNPRRVQAHHLRLWYALADLHERAGDIPAARTLFRKVSAQDPAFVDVAERLAALT